MRLLFPGILRENPVSVDGRVMTCLSLWRYGLSAFLLSRGGCASGLGGKHGSVAPLFLTFSNDNTNNTDCTSVQTVAEPQQVHAHAAEVKTEPQ